MTENVQSDDHPYSQDSINRYFKSLEAVGAENDRNRFDDYFDPIAAESKSSPTAKSGVSRDTEKKVAFAPDSDDVDKRNADAEDGGVFLSRVDEITRNLLKSIDNNDDELFTHLVSTFAAAESARPPADLSCVRDSEDFVYDDTGESRSSALRQIPDGLRNELAVDLGDSVSSVIMRQQKTMMTSEARVNDVGVASSAIGAGGRQVVADSMTFDYDDVANPMDQLPDMLKQQLKLNLRDSRDFLLSESRKSKKGTKVKVPLPKCGVDKSVEHVAKRAPSNESTLPPRESTGGEGEGSDEPKFSKTVTRRPQKPVNGSADAADESSKSVHFKTADFLKYKRERSVEIRQSAGDGDLLMPMSVKARPRSAALANGDESRAKSRVTWSRDWNDSSGDAVADSVAEPGTAAKSSTVRSATRARRQRSSDAGNRQNNRSVLVNS